MGMKIAWTKVFRRGIVVIYQYYTNYGCHGDRERNTVDKVKKIHCEIVICMRIDLENAEESMPS